MKGISIKGARNRAGGRDRGERVSDLRCSAQHVRYSAERLKFEHKHKMPTDLEKLKPVQTTAAINTFKGLYITWELHQWSVCSVKCLACVQSIVWYESNHQQM